VDAERVDAVARPDLVDDLVGSFPLRSALLV